MEKKYTCIKIFTEASMSRAQAFAKSDSTLGTLHVIIHFSPFLRMCHPCRLPNSSIILNFLRYMFLSCISANLEHRKKCCRSRQCLLTSMPFSRRSRDRDGPWGVFTGRYMSHIIVASFSNCFKRLIVECAVFRRR